MITDGILFVLQSIMSVILLPLQALDIAIDVVSSFPLFVSFLNVVTYLMPWRNIMPLIIFIVAMFAFRIVISIIRTIWDLIPFT